MDTQALCASVEPLRQRGAPRWAPVEFALVQVLAARMDQVPNPVAERLLPRLQDAIEACEARLQQRRPSRPAGTPARPSPWAPLHEALAGKQARMQVQGGGAIPGELASAARFRQAWMRQQVVDRIGQALTRRPANAGPLNSHAIALECLTLMRELSPDYLRHFMQQVEAMQLLEHLQSSTPQATVPGRHGAERGRGKPIVKPKTGRTGPARDKKA